ncbi:tRNA (adenine(22)-N(1))-methyltransferase [Halobacillus sp. H74]|uniref:tRNA (adenine(22)-N(1))-methyltransferase n=1 Tax=Halobacillus sp. H74 TaxID=3457436 RepID=UPI003FCDCD4E
MNVNQLSKRLTLVAEYLPHGSHFADIGSDHAYLPCYVCLRDPEAQAIAGEVNQGPYNSARQEVEKHELQDRIDVRLGNGLEVVQKDEVDQIVIAGMGGPLIRDILEEGKDRLTSVERIITQPNIDSKSVRQWFYKNDYELVSESIVEESGHIYEVLAAEKGYPSRPYHKESIEKEMWLGPFFLASPSETFIQKCQEELNKKEYILRQVKLAVEVSESKMDRLQQEIRWLKEVIEL